MPVFNFLHWTKDHGDTLTSGGPVVPVEIGLPTALEENYAKEGTPIPPPVSGYALIDTGAASTAANEAIFATLGVLPIDVIETWTPHGNMKSLVYPAKVSFPALNIKGLEMQRVIGSSLDWGTPDGKKIIMLLGRDLLQGCLFIYNCNASHITLVY